MFKLGDFVFQVGPQSKSVRYDLSPDVGITPMGIINGSIHSPTRRLNLSATLDAPDAFLQVEQLKTEVAKGVVTLVDERGLSYRALVDNLRINRRPSLYDVKLSSTFINKAIYDVELDVLLL